MHHHPKEDRQVLCSPTYEFPLETAYTQGMNQQNQKETSLALLEYRYNPNWPAKVCVGFVSGLE